MSSPVSKFKSTPTFTFPSPRKSIVTSNTPSPFHYNTIDSHPKQNQKYGKFNTSIRKSPIIQNKKCPGPGQYESSVSVITKSFNKKQLNHIGAARFKERQQSNPPPNFYKISHSNLRSLPKFSFSVSERKDKNKSVSPAPDSYQIDKSWINDRKACTIGVSKRNDNIQAEKTPGVGSYQKESKFISSSFNNKHRILPQQKRSSIFSLKKDIPAPGSYSQKSFVSENEKKKRGFSLINKRQDRLNKTPGPGAYQQLSKMKFASSAKFVMPRAERFSTKVQQKTNLGPGYINQSSFNAKLKSVNVHKFSKSELPRYKVLQTNDIGFINPEKLNVIYRSNPKFTVQKSERSFESAKRLPSCDRYYDVSRKSSQPSFMMPKSGRTKVENSNKIGPGHYQITDSTKKILQRKTKFAKSDRKTYFDNITDSKKKMFIKQTFETRQQFPNPPKYSNVSSKFKIIDKLAKN